MIYYFHVQIGDSFTGTRSERIAPISKMLVRSPATKIQQFYLMYDIPDIHNVAGRA